MVFTCLCVCARWGGGGAHSCLEDHRTSRHTMPGFVSVFKIRTDQVRQHYVEHTILLDKEPLIKGAWGVSASSQGTAELEEFAAEKAQQAAEAGLAKAPNMEVC